MPTHGNTVCVCVSRVSIWLVTRMQKESPAGSSRQSSNRSAREVRRKDIDRVQKVCQYPSHSAFQFLANADGQLDMTIPKIRTCNAAGRSTCVIGASGKGMPLRVRLTEFIKN